MNAIIMAAGTSSRFAPLSYEEPKGLLAVKGEILIERISRLHRHAMEDNWPECLNHCDALAANFLISDDSKEDIDMTLIDWEYSGQGDTAQDLGSFIACSDLNYDEALFAIKAYLGHEPSNEELCPYIQRNKEYSFTRTCIGSHTSEPPRIRAFLTPSAR